MWGLSKLNVISLNKNVKYGIRKQNYLIAWIRAAEWFVTS